MSKNNKRFYISIKQFIIVIFSLISIIISITFFLGFVNLMKRNQIDNLLSDTETRALRLSNQLSLYRMNMDTNDTSLDTDINESAFFSNGRIMVISRDYKIIKDTYVLKQGDYIVSEDIMNVMTKRGPGISRIRGDYAEVILPIEDENEILGVIVSTASTKKIQENNRVLVMQGAILLGIALILIIALSVPMVRIALGRLDAINRQIYHTSQGNLQDKIEEKGFKETKVLARNYNAVLEKLATVDSARQEFVSNVSHELKTPATSMKVLAESLLQNENATAEEYREFMEDIVSEVDRETEIINDLLTLVRTDRQSSTMNFSESSINEIIDSIIRTVTPLADKRGINIIYESYKDVVAEVDSVKLMLAISNLVENSVKYNVDNGWIRVSLNADASFFYIRVADSGVGIPDDSKDRVFERFYRVDKARSRDTGGTGLGLSITRNIINAHQGTVRLYSEAGKGTTFTVRIPLKQELAGDSLSDAALDKEMLDETAREEEKGSLKKKGKRKHKKSKMNIRVDSIILILAMLFSMSCTFTACSVNDGEKEAKTEELTEAAGSVQLYHVENWGVAEDSGRLQLKQPDSIPDCVEDIMAQLVLPDGITFSGYSVDKNSNIELNFIIKDVSEEVLLLSKAVIVKTFSGLKTVGDTSIVFRNENEDILESVIYGDNAFFYYDDANDSVINKGEIVLYLPDSSGRELRSVVETVTISEDESACDVVMKQLENYDVLPEGTEVMGIYVMNGTATLNLSPQFLSGDIKADDRVVIYSIVNSLTSLPNVKNVLFNVNGKLIEKYHDSIDISKQLEFSD